MNKTILKNIINIDKSELTLEIYYMKKYEGDYYGYVKTKKMRSKDKQLNGSCK